VHIQPVDLEEPVSVLLPLPTPASNPENQASDGVVNWSPPHIDWNPWTNCSAYQATGAYNDMAPEARTNRLSQDLYEQMAHRKNTDQDLQQVCVCVCMCMCVCVHVYLQLSVRGIPQYDYGRGGDTTI